MEGDIFIMMILQCRGSPRNQKTLV